MIGRRRHRLLGGSPAVNNFAVFQGIAPWEKFQISLDTTKAPFA